MQTFASTGSRKAQRILGSSCYPGPSLSTFQSITGCCGAQLCALRTAMAPFPHWELAVCRTLNVLCHVTSQQSLSHIWWPVIISHPRTLLLRVLSHVNWKAWLAVFSLEKPLDPEVIEGRSLSRLALWNPCLLVGCKFERSSAKCW